MKIESSECKWRRKRKKEIILEVAVVMKTVWQWQVVSFVSFVCVCAAGTGKEKIRRPIAGGGNAS